MEDRLTFGPRDVATNAQLDEAYTHWADHEKTPLQYRLTPKTRAGRLEAAGCTPVKNASRIRGRGWRGVAVQPCARCFRS